MAVMPVAVCNIVVDALSVSVALISYVTVGSIPVIVVLTPVPLKS